MFFNFLILENTTYTTYAQFNQFTVTGRIFSAELKTRKSDNEQFLTMTVITNGFKGDDTGMVVSFADSGEMLDMYIRDLLPLKRQVTITGHIMSVAETFTNSDGELQMLKRPQINLTNVSVPMGGLGPVAKTDGDKPQRKVGAVIRPSGAKPADKQAAYGEATPQIDGTPAF